jgi:regulator of telomere elongation helicase 1
VFIAVCRGKLSEGIDFTDNAARCVIIAGIPYPQIFDPKVVTKRDYLDRKYANGKSSINGNSWYKLQACRAVNQAVGRVIRHANDYGAIILMDERFCTHNMHISSWLNSRKTVYTQLPTLEQDLKRFFKANGCEATHSEVSF